jgi:hypothetical protein
MKMNKDEFESSLRSLLPLSKITRTESGICTWIGIYIDNRSFSIQITPNEGVGVSEIDTSLDVDFSGHDDVFRDLDEALEFLKTKLAR